MASRLEIRLKKELPDAEGNNIKKKAVDYFGLAVKDIRVIKILTLDAELSETQLKDVKAEIFTNPVIEESSFSAPIVCYRI